MRRDVLLRWWYAYDIYDLRWKIMSIKEEKYYKVIIKIERSLRKWMRVEALENKGGRIERVKMR